jgi:hypothetical protein
VGVGDGQVDFGSPSPPALTLGSLIAELGISELEGAGLREPLPEPVRWLLETADGGSTARLCSLGEMALQAHRATGDPDYASNARQIAAQLLARRNATGRWLADQRGPEHHNLSLVDGLPAVGLLLLGAAGSRLPSARLVAYRQPPGGDHGR